MATRSSIAAASYVVNPFLFDSVPYDPRRDFSAVTVAATAPTVLAVHPSVQARNIDELVALVRANPGKFSYASPGPGTPPISSANCSGSRFCSTWRTYRTTVEARPSRRHWPVTHRSRSGRCLPRSSTSRTAGCVRWRSPAALVRRHCPTSARQQKRGTPTSLRTSGLLCSFPAVLRARSSRV